MKKLLLSAFIISLSLSSAEAAFNADIFGSTVFTGDAMMQFGGGLQLGWNFEKSTNAVIKTTYSMRSSEKTLGTLSADSSYDHIMLLGGIEYTPPIRFLYKYRMKWRNSLLLGASHTSVKINDPINADADDGGLSIAIYTGLSFDWFQHFSPFIEAGYHKSFYRGDFINNNISGAVFNLGIRYNYSLNRTLDYY